jgi:hypothetical protein
MKTTPPRAPTRLKRPTTRCFVGCCLCLGYSGNWLRRKNIDMSAFQRRPRAPAEFTEPGPDQRWFDLMVP